MSGPWAFVVAAYWVTAAGLVALTIAIFLSLRHWARRARDEDRS